MPDGGVDKPSSPPSSPPRRRYMDLFPDRRRSITDLDATTIDDILEATRLVHASKKALEENVQWIYDHKEAIENNLQWLDKMRTTLEMDAQWLQGRRYWLTQNQPAIDDIIANYHGKAFSVKVLMLVSGIIFSVFSFIMLVLQISDFLF